MSARFALKAATAADHDRLDGLFSAFDLAKRPDYETFLLAQAEPFIATEAALERAGICESLPDWPERRRTAALLSDLADLGLDAPVPSHRPALASGEESLGAAYVLEGSRLGGAFLVRQVPPGLPTAFLAPGNPILWRAFVNRLDERLSSARSIEQAAVGASAIFALFEQSARKWLGVNRP